MRGRTQPVCKYSLTVYQEVCYIVYTLYNVFFLFCFSGTESTSTNTVIITAVCVVAGVVVITVAVAVIVFKLKRKPPSVERTKTFPIRFYDASPYRLSLLRIVMKL